MANSQIAEREAAAIARADRLCASIANKVPDNIMVTSFGPENATSHNKPDTDFLARLDAGEDLNDDYLSDLR